METTYRNETHKTCSIVCDMLFENQRNCDIVKLEIEGKPKIVNEVMDLIAVDFSLRINFHGGIGYAKFFEQKNKTLDNINIIHFLVEDIDKIKNNGIRLDGAIIFVTLSRMNLTSSTSWVSSLETMKREVNPTYDSCDESVDESD